MKPPTCQVRVPTAITLTAHDNAIVSCDAGFWAQVWISQAGHFTRKLTWHRRPDGLIGIHVKSTPTRVIRRVEILCGQGHTYPYQEHPWEVLECAGFSAPPR